MTDVKLFRSLNIPIISVRSKGPGKHAFKRLEFFKNGNNYATKERMSPESHERRMAGLRKAWEVAARRKNGEKMGITRRKRTRLRLKLRKTVAKEAQEIQNIAREHADQAMVALAEIVNNPTAQDSVKIAAAAVILDRAYGKASQTNINANVNADGKPSEISGKTLDERVTAALKRVEALTGGKAEASKGKKRPADIREPDPDTNGSTKH